MRPDAGSTPLIALRRNTTRVLAWLNVVLAVVALIASLWPGVGLPATQWLALGSVPALVALALSYVRVDVARWLFPFQWALAMVVLAPSTEPGAATFIPGLIGALTVGARGSVSAMVTVVVGFLARDGASSAYVQPGALVTIVFGTALLVLLETTLVRLGARVAGAEKRLATVAAETHDVVLLLRVAHARPEVEVIGGALDKAFGYASDDLQRVRVRDVIHAEDFDAARAAWERVDQGAASTATLEMRVRRKDGEWRWVTARIADLKSHASIGGLAITLHDITAVREERLDFERRLVHQASHDSLTGLGNRRLLLDRLRDAIAAGRRDGRLRAALFVDLDNFKVLNDSLGHQAGDALLVEVAARLSSTLRPGDTAARLGSDEFVLLLEDLPSPDAALTIAARARDAVAKPVVVGGQTHRIDASVGVVPLRAEHNEAEDVLRDADVAAVAAKDAGKGRVLMFEDRMRSAVSRRLDIERALREAIDRGELRLVYQPKFRLSDGSVSGVEALMRWHNPERGMVGPGEFIPVAEETGLIVPMGRWALHEACRQLCEWRTNAPHARFPVAVNLSGKQIHHERLVDEVAEVVRATGVGSDDVELEITETVAMANAATVIDRLQALRRVGVRFSVDDFGTGYSSLAYLRRFPVDGLKVDRAFVSGLGKHSDDEEIVRFLIALAKSLGLKTIAEGVETSEQLAALRGLGCDEAQGFLLAKPAAPDVIERLLRDGLPDASRALFADRGAAGVSAARGS